MGKNDHEAIRAVLAGEKDAYGALVVRHSQSLFRVAFRITGNESDAEDVVQEAFLRGYRKLDSFESRSNFGTWIYRIAVRCALDRIGAMQEAALRSLTPTERTAFMLRHMEDCTGEEIGEVLGIPPNAAKQAVFRAVKKLRSRLAPLRVMR